MSEKRIITKGDILLKARLLSEGVRVEEKRSPENGIIRRTIVLGGCEMVTILRQNPYSRLDAVIDGEDVTISETGEVLGTGRLEEPFHWRDTPMSDGTTVSSVLSGSKTIINIVLNFRCYNFDTGKGCKYCGLFAGPLSRAFASQPRSAVRRATARQVEAAVIGIRNGWRGTMVLTGGALPPSERNQLTDAIERVMTQFHESLDETTLSQLHIAPNVYPPADFSEMNRWKELGCNSTEFDLEVMDPAYFRAICPGKSETYPHEYWKEAQEASAEVFGRGRGATTAVVMGVEPMSSLVEGVEERISKGVYTTPLMFIPSPGSPYAEFRPPAAPWIVEASEKMADAYFRYANTLDVNLLTDGRPGFTRIGRSFFSILVVDEMVRRLQEMGKLPAGLPIQDFAASAEA